MVMRLFRRKKKDISADSWQRAWLDAPSWSIMDIISKSRWRKEKKMFGREEWVAQLEMFVETSYSCTKKIADTYMGVPKKLYTTKQSSATKTLTTKQKDVMHANQVLQKQVSSSQDIFELTKHPFLDLMWKVNPNQTSSLFENLTVIFMCLTGNCFWRLVKIGNTTERIWILPTQNFKDMELQQDEIVNYIFKSGKEDVKFAAQEIVHFKTANPFNQKVGISPVAGGGISISRSDKMDTYDNSLLENDGMIMGYLKTEQVINDETAKEIKKRWKEKYGGMHKAGDIAVLDRNLDFQNLGIAPKDMGFTFGRRYTREQIASSFGVPIQLVSGEITGRSTLDVAREQLLTDAVIPMLTLNMETINEHLLPRLGYNDDTLFYWFENPVTDDKEVEQKTLSGYVESAIMTTDEARAKLMLEPLGIDYLMYHGVPIGAEQQAKALVDSIDKAVAKRKNMVSL
jgi:HK97 family phage portal protein